MEKLDKRYIQDKGYPQLLAEIHDPPDPLYIRGTFVPGDQLIVAVVGSRKATSCGQEAVKRIIEPLASSGVIIVSGLAYGIDKAAHLAALAVGGTTWAVLGTPINHIYPAAHRSLAQRILEHGGAIISENAPGSETFKWSFAKRNRIIAGLAHATIVIEAALDSGSLITAQSALEENRDVFAVPGPITSPFSIGTNNFLKLGARPVTEAADILSFFGREVSAVSIKPTDLKNESGLITAIPADTPIHIDNLLKTATIDLPVLQSELTLLELRGRIKMVQPGWYIRII